MKGGGGDTILLAQALEKNDLIEFWRIDNAGTAAGLHRKMDAVLPDMPGRRRVSRLSRANSRTLGRDRGGRAPLHGLFQAPDTIFPSLFRTGDTF